MFTDSSCSFTASCGIVNGIIRHDRVISLERERERERAILSKSDSLESERERADACLLVACLSNVTRSKLKLNLLVNCCTINQPDSAAVTCYNGSNAIEAKCKQLIVQYFRFNSRIINSYWCTTRDTHSTPGGAVCLYCGVECYMTLLLLLLLLMCCCCCYCVGRGRRMWWNCWRSEDIE